MSSKKSYMDKSNIINESLLTKVFDYLTKGKLSQLKKDFKDDKDIQKKIKKMAELGKETEKIMKKRGYDFNASKGGWIKKESK